MGVQCGTLRGVGSLAYRTLRGGEESPILHSALCTEHSALCTEEHTEHLLIAHWRREESPILLHTAQHIHCTAQAKILH